MPGNQALSPPPFRVVNAHGQSPFVLVCEHASNFIPPHYHSLGLPQHELQRHIAWDIGAAEAASALSAFIDAPLIISNYSRLLVDLNRPLHSTQLMPVVSELTEIPGNRNMTESERRWRIDNLFTPFQNAVASVLERRQAAGQPTHLLAVHSFTPLYMGVARPWHAGVLYRKSKGFGEALIAALGGKASHVAANQPYQIDDDGDYTIPIHGEARGLDAVLLEIRQDLIGDPAGAEAWARRLATALSRCPFG